MSIETKVNRNNWRAIRKGSIANLLVSQYEKIRDIFKDTNNIVHCCFCGGKIYEHAKAKYQNETMEHMDIVAIGGTTSSNCLPSCEKCNSSKGERGIEWYFEQSFFKEELYEKIVDAHTLFNPELDIKTVVENDPNLSFETEYEEISIH